MEIEENEMRFLDNIKVKNYDPNRIFKLDYKGQKIENNKMYDKWKQSMITKFGNDGKFIFCQKDDIYFYISHNDYINSSSYQSVCPLCSKPICYYCSRFISDVYYENGSCCLKRKIKYIFNHDIHTYINQTDRQKELYPYQKFLKIFLIPFLSFLYFIARIHISFFYKLTMKNSQLDDNGYLAIYKNNLLYKNFFITLDIISSAFLTIPFIIINIYIIIIVLLISFPFKLIPLKYFLGIIYGTFIW